MLSRLSVRQLFRFRCTRVRLRLQMFRRQEHDLVSVSHADTLFKRVQGTIEPIGRIRWRRRVGGGLHLMDMAALCAAQRPMLEPGS